MKTLYSLFVFLILVSGCKKDVSCNQTAVNPADYPLSNKNGAVWINNLSSNAISIDSMIATYPASPVLYSITDTLAAHDSVSLGNFMNTNGQITVSVYYMELCNSQRNVSIGHGTSSIVIP
jgi:hypothetical protein